MRSDHFYATLNQFAVYFDVPMAIQNTARFESVNEWIVPTTPGPQFEHINIFMTNVDHEQPLKVINFDCDEAIASEQQMQDVMTEFDLSLLDM